LEAVLGGLLAGLKCQCDCGKQCVCKSAGFTSGITKSCGTAIFDKKHIMN